MRSHFCGDAHSAFAKIGNAWYRIKHPEAGTVGSGTITGSTVTGADDTNFAIGRWLCAQHVARNMMDIYARNNPSESVNYQTFMVDDYKNAENMEDNIWIPNANLSFKMYRLYSYASKTQTATMIENNLLFEKTMWSWK